MYYLARKITLPLIAIILSQSTALISQSRLFHYGPKAFYSMQYFPQDGLLQKLRASYLYVGHQQNDWSGNLNDPRCQSYENYNISSGSLKMTHPDVDFDANGYCSFYDLEISPFFISMRKLHFQTFFEYHRELFFFEANGTDSWLNKKDESIEQTFQARVERQNFRVSGGGAAAVLISQCPLGIRFRLAYEKIGEPVGGLKTTQPQSHTSTNQLTWGWLVNPEMGDNLLGAEAHIDGFTQQRYDISSAWRAQTIIGFSTKRNKFALQWKLRLDNFKQYEYDINFDDYFINGSVANRYMTNSWRFSCLSQIIKFESQTLSLLSDIKYNRRATSEGALTGGANQTRFFQQTLQLETGPICYFHNRYARVTAGFLISGGLSNFKNYKISCNSEVYQAGHFRNGWPDYSDDPSYGKHPFAAYSLEINIEIPVFRNPDLCIRAELWQQHKRTYSALFYGENEIATDLTLFHETAIRNSLNKETRLGGQLGVWYYFKSCFGGFFFDLPVSFGNVKQTDLTQTGIGLTFKAHKELAPVTSEQMKIKILFGKFW